MPYCFWEKLHNYDIQEISEKKFSILKIFNFAFLHWCGRESLSLVLEQYTTYVKYIEYYNFKSNWNVSLHFATKILDNK